MGERIELAATSEGLALTAEAGALIPAVSAKAFLYKHGTQEEIAVYAQETGSQTLPQPLTSNTEGLFPGWIEGGQTINIVVNQGGVASPTRTIEAVKGSVAAKLGTDGTVGGPGGSPLSSSVVTGNAGKTTASSYGAATIQGTALSLPLTIAPTAEKNGLLLQLPAYASEAYVGFKIVDTAANHARMLHLEHYGEGNEVGGGSYALNILNYPKANSAFVIHQYSGFNPAVLIDNTNTERAIRLRNTENPINSPGNWGSGYFMDFWAYKTRTTVAKAGSWTTGTKILKSSVATFENSLTNKPIEIENGSGPGETLKTTLVEYISPTEAEIASTFITTSEGNSFTYQTKTDVGLIGILTAQMKLQISGALNPLTFTTEKAETPVLTLEQPTGGASTATGLKLTQASPAPGIELTQTGAGTAVIIKQTGNAAAMTLTQEGEGTALTVTQKKGFHALVVEQAGAAAALQINANNTASEGFYPLVVNGYKYGPLVEVSHDSGVAFQVKKTSTGAGTVVLIANAGTGDSLNVEAGGSKLRINSTGVGFNGNAPVAKAAAIPSPAAELGPLKTAVDAIRETIKNVGLTE